MTRFAFVLLLAPLLQTQLAAAQTSVQGGQFRQQRVVDDTLNRKGRWELGLNVAGAMSFGSSTPDGGDSISQSNLYLTASAVVGYMLLDNFELRLAAGLQYVGQSVGDDASISSPGFVGALQALYQRDLVLGLAIYAGVGVGGFYGSRTIEAGMGLERRFTTVGGVGQALLGLLMMPGPRLILRGGLRADFLFGSESPEDDMGGTIPDSSFFTTQILFDVAIGLRFG